jgi:hypothetical protein
MSNNHQLARIFSTPRISRPANRAFLTIASTFLVLIAAPQITRAQQSPIRAEISFDQSLSNHPIDGRIFLVVSASKDNVEPRLQVVEVEARSQQVFGVDVDALAAGTSVNFDDSVLGYPARSFRDIPAGDYTVQGVLNIYTTFHRADGVTVKLPADQGEGQHWDTKPGNFYSKPQHVHIDPASPGAVISIKLTEIIPPIEAPKDTEWVKHVRVQSQLLTKFWGQPMYLGAIVVLPEGWQTHPNAHYPLLVEQGHFPRDYTFQTKPPVANLQGGQLSRAQTQYQFFQDWSTGKLPRMIMLLIQHANPYYDDSYAVNSANLGPYGDAINNELIPEIEKQFRGIGQGWARALFGGSTGGWETIATQVFYPDNYNGAWTACPDPVDFHAYQLINIYDDQNAYWTQGAFSRIYQPEMRVPNGTILATNEGSNRWELVLATHGRSGEQWDIWQAVFSPAGSDGYPKEIFDQRTGVIDHAVADYWRQHYDLNAILQRDWKTLGPKLQGKLHFYVGTADTYYLDGAVHLLQASLEKTTDPHSDADFDYGVDQPHCYTGPAGSTTREGGATFTQRVLKAAEERMLKSAPAGADLTSWRY